MRRPSGGTRRAPRVTPARPASRARLVAAVVALACAGVALAPVRAEPTVALFSDDEHAAGTLTARTLAPPVPTTCSIGALGFSVIFRWTLPAGETAVGYEVYYPNGGLAQSGTLSSTATSHEYNKGLSPTGTYTWRLFTVVPGSAWRSTARTGSAAINGLLVSSSCAWNP